MSQKILQIPENTIKDHHNNICFRYVLLISGLQLASLKNSWAWILEFVFITLPILTISTLQCQRFFHFLPTCFLVFWSDWKCLGVYVFLPYCYIFVTHQGLLFPLFLVSNFWVERQYRMLRQCVKMISNWCIAFHIHILHIL